MYSGKVIRCDSFNPKYVIKFSFICASHYIHEGIAIFMREPPIPKVTFDDYTDHQFERSEMDEPTLQNIKLEIGKTVCAFLLGQQRD